MGDPIAHSLSPVMHNAAIAALGLDARYVALRTTHQAFVTLIRELLEEGGGCSVTRPFKDDAFALEGERSDDASRTRAVNCISGPPERPSLDNTDVVGIGRAARDLTGGERIERAVIVGTGGSARAAAVALTGEWPGCRVDVVSRSPGRRSAFLAWAGDAGVATASDALPPGAPRLIINATPVDDVAQQPGAGDAYLDLKYAPVPTPTMRRAREAGARAADGRGVLLHQGVAAFKRLFGVEPPVDVMRKAVEDALRP